MRSIEELKAKYAELGAEIERLEQEPEEIDWAKVPVDQPVLVRDSDGDWIKSINIKLIVKSVIKKMTDCDDFKAGELVLSEEIQKRYLEEVGELHACKVVDPLEAVECE